MDKKIICLEKGCQKNFLNQSDGMITCIAFFCWDKISDCCEDALEFGYCTQDEEHWICETCYKDFKDSFKWELE